VNFQLGMELHGKYTVFAEGARGHLGKQLIAKYKLDEGKDPQSYAIGIKELWEIDPQAPPARLVVHTAGWPMDEHTYGGAFLYHLEDNKVTLGFVTGLDYTNPYLSPFEEFQRWKTHPNVRHTEAHLARSAKRLATARAPSTPAACRRCPNRVPRRRAGGLRRRLPERSRIKGSHAAIKTGMLAAEAAYDAVVAGAPARRAERLPRGLRTRAGCYTELNKDRNFKNWFKKGLTGGTLMNGIEQFVLRGHPPWTLHRDKPTTCTSSPPPSASPSTTPSPTAS
jgi:electron-transferring-flavoprotein dehydrogenase